MVVFWSTDNTPSAASILAAISVASAGICLSAGLLNTGRSLISTNRFLLYQQSVSAYIEAVGGLWNVLS